MITDARAHSATVLIVHQLPLMRRALREALAHEPRICVIGSTAFDAIGLSLAHDRRPDAIIVDPVGDPAHRVAVIEALRHAAPTCAIIVMLPHDMVLDAGALRAAGATSFIDSYAHADEVLAAVRAWCERALGADDQHSWATDVSWHSPAEATATSPPQAEILHDTDLELLRLVAEGHTDLQISQQLYVSPRTVQKHLARLRRSADCANRSQLVSWFMRHSGTPMST